MGSCPRLSSVAARVTGFLLVFLVLLAPPPAHAGFVNFESGHVRPLALSPDGNRLFAVNTPDNRLAIYDITAGGLTLAAEVPVGLEPVAVAARTVGVNQTEVWVVNHLSDSVSIIQIDPVVGLSHVTRTLLVGDEPRDIVFAGSPVRNRAFITCARRGQNRFPATPDTGPQLTTQGVGRADVWAFNADSPGAALGGTPLSIVQLFGDTPRALAVSNDGATVFAAVFQSGNRTTAITESLVSSRGGLPAPPANSTPGAPTTGLIVKFNAANSRWEDELATNWTTSVPFSLPDRDVFLINANGSSPALAGGTNFVTGVGNILFNMVVRPTNGRLYVANTDARNEVRFEPVIRGHIAESHITVINGTTPSVRHLNPHIVYGTTPGSPAEINNSLAFPMDMTFSADGNTLFVVGFGSGAVGVFDANAIETGTINQQFAPGTRSLVPVGSGPSGIVLDVGRDRLYVMNRIDHTISIVSNAAAGPRSQTGVVPLRFDPSPPPAKDGRRFLYDAKFTSGHGDSACASCHIFGDFDSLAWDLGDPFGTVVSNPNPFANPLLRPPNPRFHPMKGPMTTQSLRGMAGMGPMHWRGDRTGGTTGGDPLDEQLAFKAFNPAFVGLLGRGTQLTTTEMQAFTDFILTVQYPPNPIRALDNVPTTAQTNGQTFFSSQPTDAVFLCNTCHSLPFGTAGLSSIEGEPQELKVPHLRNAYQKVGMFAAAGNQIRGFGFLHDGSIATVFDFLHAGVFAFPNGNVDRRNLEAFIMALDTGLKPVVGQQVSLTFGSVNDSTVTGRIDLLIARANVGDCELIVKGNINGVPRGAVYVGGNNFQPDRNPDALISKGALNTLAATAATGWEQVYTCVPPGSGVRMGVDRDEDGFFDRTEIEAGTDPANPLSFPSPNSTTTTSSTTSTSSTTTSSTLQATLISTRAFAMVDGNLRGDPNRRRVAFSCDTRLEPIPITAPPPDGVGDPRLYGATVHIYNAAGLAPDDVTIFIPPGPFWTSPGRTFTGYQYRNPDRYAAITRLTVRTNQIALQGGRASWPYTLDEPRQGQVGVTIQLGSAPPWCASVPARQSGYPPSTARNDQVDKFAGQPRSPAPAVCPQPPPPPGSPSGAFLDPEASLVDFR